MINAIIFQSWKDQFPEMISFFGIENLIAPAGSCMVVILMLMAPHSKVCFIQTFRRCGCMKKPSGMSKRTYLTKEEWKKYSIVG